MEQHIAPSNSEPRDPLLTRSPSTGIGDEYKIPPPASTSFSVLKDRIKQHYEICSDYYYSLWGEHIHHGYFLHPEDTKELAQTRLIDLLLETSNLARGSSVLDVGCGIGGTTRYLAREKACNVTGITISGQQVKMARQLTAKEAASGGQDTDGATPVKLNDGIVRYMELDAEKMGDFFNKATFDAVWISEAMSHLPDKELFFRNAETLLKSGGKLVVADWFKGEDLTETQMDADIKPIEGQGSSCPTVDILLIVLEDGMLLPSLCTTSDYVQYAQQVGLKVFAKPIDISKEVSKTW
ncbi:hypothetical protein OEA41_010766 [Lepraria neglecta]|uniref:Methyltransferase type 11 domain-containing protein n=1 Tax=Lepraria neglecta TaxID=209136 RepID=A0AAD9YWZ6_9LECA|nr:hypothetical protein OEA41_010766 [Lepraria neglecta]